MSSLSGTYWISRITVQILSAVSISILFVIHSSKTWIDLQKPPNKTLSISTQRSNKWTKICTLLSVLLYTLNVDIVVFKYFTFAISACWMVEEFVIIFYSAAKCAMYIVFLFRLHTIFGSHNVTFLKTFGLCIIIIFMLLHIWDFLYRTQDPFIYESISFASNCGTKQPPLPMLVFTVMDIMVAVFFIITFNRSLRKLMKKVTATNLKSKQKNLMEIAHKAAILASSAGISTLIMVIVVIGVRQWGLLIYSIDTLINVLSLVLMTEYYSDNKFNILCCPIISLFRCCCCHSFKKETFQKETLDSKSSVENVKNAETHGVHVSTTSRPTNDSTVGTSTSIPMDMLPKLNKSITSVEMDSI